jgi:hypothetical protein
MKKTLILITIFLVSAAFSYYVVKNLSVKNSENTAIERVVETQEKNIEVIQ